MTYVKLDGAAARVDALAIEVQVHREILIRANLLNPVSTVIQKPRP